MEKYVFYSVTTVARYLLFSYVWKYLCPKSSYLWKSLSVYWCRTRIWSRCHFASSWIMRLKDNAHGPSPIRLELTFGVYLKQCQYSLKLLLLTDLSQNSFCLSSDLVVQSAKLSASLLRHEKRNSRLWGFRRKQHKTN